MMRLWQGRLLSHSCSLVDGVGIGHAHLVRWFGNGLLVQVQMVVRWELPLGLVGVILILERIYRHRRS